MEIWKSLNSILNFQLDAIYSIQVNWLMSQLFPELSVVG